MQSGLALATRLGQLSQEQADSTPARIRTGTMPEELSADADLVIEAVSVDLTVKQEVFRALDIACPPRAILASTTSALLPSALTSATRRPTNQPWTLLALGHAFALPGRIADERGRLARS